MMIGNIIKKIRSTKNMYFYIKNISEIVKRCRKFLEESFEVDKCSSTIRADNTPSPRLKPYSILKKK